MDNNEINPMQTAVLANIIEFFDNKSNIDYSIIEEYSGDYEFYYYVIHVLSHMSKYYSQKNEDLENKVIQYINSIMDEFKKYVNVSNELYAHMHKNLLTIISFFDYFNNVCVPIIKPLFFNNDNLIEKCYKYITPYFFTNEYDDIKAELHPCNINEIMQYIEDDVVNKLMNEIQINYNMFKLIPSELVEKYNNAMNIDEFMKDERFVEYYKINSRNSYLHSMFDAINDTLTDARERMIDFYENTRVNELNDKYIDEVTLYELFKHNNRIIKYLEDNELTRSEWKNVFKDKLAQKK